MSGGLVLVVPDGAADPLGADPTCLEAARTPQLDRLAEHGVLRRLTTIPPGLLAGTEVGLPALLGVAAGTPPARGRLEAAAAGVALAAGESAWRLDLVPPSDATPDDVACLGRALAPLGARVHLLRGHRMLLVGPAAWGHAPPGPHQTDRELQEVATGPFAAVVEAAHAALQGRQVWPWGAGSGPAVWPHLPTTTGRSVVMLTSGGAAAGVGTLLGARVVRTTHPADHAAAVLHGDPRAVVIVHVDTADEAAHARDRVAKIAALEALDAEVLAPLIGLAARYDATLVVAPDHGCDPATGRHTPAAVPALHAASAAAPHAPRTAGRRLTERHVAALPACPAHTLLPGLLAAGGSPHPHGRPGQATRCA